MFFCISALFLHNCADLLRLNIHVFSLRIHDCPYDDIIIPAGYVCMFMLVFFVFSYKWEVPLHFISSNDFDSEGSEDIYWIHKNQTSGTFPFGQKRKLYNCPNTKGLHKFSLL